MMYSIVHYNANPTFPSASKAIAIRTNENWVAVIHRIAVQFVILFSRLNYLNKYLIWHK